VPEKAWQTPNGTLQSDCDITRILEVDQKPIGINSRSTPASYLGIFDEIRKLYSANLEARARGWKDGYFSYNTGKGRCPECKGQGQIKLEMNFLPDAYMDCDICSGRRFAEEALSVQYLGLNISQVLGLTFGEAREHFRNHRKIYAALETACKLGLEYLTLGQSSATLSGGESQRIKLVSELSARPRGHTIYILDEPTTGLHKSDVSRLTDALRELVTNGNSVFVIEHDSDVLAASDHVIEMGPGPGDAGGSVIFSGSYESLQKARTPWGQTLRSLENT
jgi:excinuclease ABC subunit A